jgi:TolA-binding protein
MKPFWFTLPVLLAYTVAGQAHEPGKAQPALSAVSPAEQEQKASPPSGARRSAGMKQSQEEKEVERLKRKGKRLVRKGKRLQAQGERFQRRVERLEQWRQYRERRLHTPNR